MHFMLPATSTPLHHPQIRSLRPILPRLFEGVFQGLPPQFVLLSEGASWIFTMFKIHSSPIDPYYRRASA